MTLIQLYRNKNNHIVQLDSYKQILIINKGIKINGICYFIVFIIIPSSYSNITY